MRWQAIVDSFLAMFNLFHCQYLQSTSKWIKVKIYAISLIDSIIHKSFFLRSLVYLNIDVAGVSYQFTYSFWRFCTTIWYKTRLIYLLRQKVTRDSSVRTRMNETLFAFISLEYSVLFWDSFYVRQKWSAWHILL